MEPDAGREIVMFNFKERRYGKVLLFAGLMSDEPEKFIEEYAPFIFKNCIILGATQNFFTHNVEYTLYSPKFEIVPYHQEIPEYQGEITVEYGDNNELATIDFKWKKL